MIGVTCICPTYKRVPYPLEEALYCFLQQDYSKKELVISNDDPDIELRFNHPDVKINNHKKRFRNLYEKVNYEKDRGEHELLMDWSDDDLYAPWALSTAVKCWEKNEKPFVSITPHYKVSPKGYGILQAVLAGQNIVSRDAWRQCGGHPVSSMKRIEGGRMFGNDRLVLNIAKKKELYGQERTKDDEIYFAWRCSVNNKWGRRNWNCKDKQKYIEKPRKPEIYELKPRLKNEFKPFGYRKETTHT